MNEESGRIFDHAILSAWQDELKAARNPIIKKQCLEQEPELLPQFAEHYQKIKALPRRMRRRVQRQWKRSLAGLALLMALGLAPALAATIDVGGNCTLVRAINAANNDSTAGGRCREGSGADRIVLPSGSTQTLTAVNNTTPYGPTGLPVIRSDITIIGNNSTITRAPSAPDFRILAVGDPGNLTLRDTTITDGIATDVGGVDYSGSGGGILHVGSYTTLTITNSTISGNTAASEGGGIDIHGIINIGPSNLELTNSTVSDNSAQQGGGIDIFSADATVRRSTISGNTADVGGGVVNYRESVTLTNSTISGNSADGSGGGALNSFGQMFFFHSTVSGNTANTSGGGVYSGGLLTRELRSDVVFNRTLIAGNTAANGAEVFQASGGVVSANNFNLFGHSELTTAQALGGGGLILSGSSDITATSDGNNPTALEEILNTALANNGGPTLTHDLPSGSPAVDAVTNVDTCPPPNTDQRGVSRPQDGNKDGGLACDIGSVERQ